MDEVTNNNISNNCVDLIILGAGPIGLFAAYYAGFRNMTVKLIDALPMPGGRLAAVYPEKHIYDVPGFKKVLAGDLASRLLEQAMEYNPQFALGESGIELIKVGEKLFKVTTSKSEHWARSVLIVSGVGLYKAKRHNAAGALEFEGKGIEYAVLNKDKYANKDVIIAGGGDSALDWAFELESIARSVTLIHRSQKFRASDSNVQRLFSSRIKTILDSEIIRFSGQDNLNEIEVRHIPTGTISNIKTHSVVVMFGFLSALGKISEWGLLLEENGIKVNSKMETNIPGIYSAGDICSHTAKLQLIVTGFGEATTAVNFAKHYLEPTETIQPMHSTLVMDEKNKS